MADEPGVTLHITFRTPPPLQDRQKLHNRRFPHVPRSTAQRIGKDFATYLQTARETVQRKVYRYRQRQQEARNVMLPLDFEEVVSISVEAP